MGSTRGSQGAQGPHGRFPSVASGISGMGSNTGAAPRASVKILGGHTWSADPVRGGCCSAQTHHLNVPLSPQTRAPSPRTAPGRVPEPTSDHQSTAGARVWCWAEEAASAHGRHHRGLGQSSAEAGGQLGVPSGGTRPQCPGRDPCPLPCSFPTPGLSPALQPIPCLLLPAVGSEWLTRGESSPWTVAQPGSGNSAKSPQS